MAAAVEAKSEAERLVKQPFATARDLLGVLQMAAGWVMTGLLPVSCLPSVSRALATATLALVPTIGRDGVGLMRRHLGSRFSEERLIELFREHYIRRFEHVAGRILDTHRRGWHPEIDLEGSHYLREALQRGHGAVIWGMSFCGNVVFKSALHREGFAVTHLSTPYHGGFSRSVVAVRVLNRWGLRSENKYLTERVVMPLDGSLGYLRILKRRLHSNGCLSIRGEHRGRQNVTVRFLSGEREFATGAASLASSTGAALLTMSACRVGPFRYRAVIQPPVEMERGCRKEELRRAAVAEFARRLERQILDHTPDWDGWTAPDLL